MQQLYIDEPQALATLCERLAGCDWVTLDTEFMREKTYFPRLCLLQVATDELVACVDPLAVDIAPLLDRLYDPALTKVVHSGRQDLELFFGLRGSLPAPVFDTQLAATVLGYGDQVGYGNLVKALLGVELEKAHTRADWSHRPLEPEQIRYAEDDVRYLVSVYHRLRGLLEERDRLGWLAEDFNALCDPALYANPPREAWKRIKGNNRLRGVQLAVLQRLAAWREETAQQRDLPRRWVAADEVLLEAARQMPDNPGKLGRIRGITKPLLERHGDALLALIQEGRETPQAQWPHLAPRAGLTPEQDVVADAMMAVVRRCGIDNEVSPTAIATRRDLEALLLGDPECPLLHGWRAAVAGKAVQALLSGETALHLEDGRLVLANR